MRIHNFYSDILISIRTLFDEVIFKKDVIKSYSFNIANRSFELSKKDYKTTYELPAAIVSLQDDSYTFGERPGVIQQLTVENMNQILVLHDETSEVELYIQEEHTQVQLSIQINCESQFQAKDIEFLIKRSLPLGKFIQLFSFSSFLELPPGYLMDLGIDINSNNVKNLFIKFDKNSGRPEPCCALNFKPLLNLTSISSNISDSSQRTFSVDVSLVYQIQKPMWIFANKMVTQEIKAISIDFFKFDNAPIMEMTNVKPGTFLCDHVFNILISDITEPQYDYSEVTNPDNNEKTYLFSIDLIAYDIPVDFDKLKINIFDVNQDLHQHITNYAIDRDISKINFVLNEFQFKLSNATLITPIVIQLVQT